MRLNYSDEEEFGGQFHLWQTNCQRSLRGRAGQAALRRLEAALVALPEHELIQGSMAHPRTHQVCAIGALALAEGKLQIPELEEDEDRDDDGDDYVVEFATVHLAVPRLVAWKVVAMNDILLDTVWEVGHGPLRPHEASYRGGIALIREMTPEERYDKMLAWVRAQLNPATPTPSE